MKCPYVSIRIQLNDFDEGIRIFAELPLLMAYEGIEPISFPAENADVFDRMSATPAYIKRRVMGTRNQVAQVITKAVLDELAKRDTWNGYTKAELEK